MDKSVISEDREAFRADFDLGKVHVAIRDCARLSVSEASFLASALNRYGFVILDHVPSRKPRPQLLALSSLMGGIIPHARSEQDGLAVIAPAPGDDDYLSSSCLPHPPHTDGAFYENPPALTLLQCLRQASEGGETQLVSGMALYNFLAASEPEALHSLFLSDALKVERAGEAASGRVFEAVEGRIRIRLRLDGTAAFAGRAPVQAMMARCRAFLQDRSNVLQFTLCPHQILIIDNFGLMHGRTGFPEGSGRRLLRAHCDGTRVSELGIRLGFQALVPIAPELAR